MAILSEGSINNQDHEFHYLLRSNYSGEIEIEIAGGFASLELAAMAFKTVYGIASALGHDTITHDNFSFFRDIIFNDDLPWTDATEEELEEWDIDSKSNKKKRKEEKDKQ